MSSYRNFARRDFVGAIAVAGVGGLTTVPAPAQTEQVPRKLKIFAHWDMEGASGIFTREQAWYWENGVREHIPREARGMFTADVNAASAAALEAGATELIVSDTHQWGWESDTRQGPE